MTKITVKWKIGILLLLALTVNLSSGEPIIFANYKLNELSAGTTSVNSIVDAANQPTINFPGKEMILL
jgi:hypothetical protein